MAKRAGGEEENNPLSYRLIQDVVGDLFNPNSLVDGLKGLGQKELIDRIQQKLDDATKALDKRISYQISMRENDTWVSEFEDEFKKINKNLDRKINEAVKASIEPESGKYHPILFSIVHGEDLFNFLHAFWPSSEEIGVNILRTLALTLQIKPTLHHNFINQLINHLTPRESDESDSESDSSDLDPYYVRRLCGRVDGLGTMKTVFIRGFFEEEKKNELKTSLGEYLYEVFDDTKHIYLDELGPLLYTMECRHYVK